jgi:hypothetical protein
MADPGGRPGDAEVERLVERADELLGQLEQVPGPGGELGLAAVAALTELYAEAFGRIVDSVRCSPAVLRALTGDALVGRLLALHGVHPDAVERRVTRALDGLRLELAPLGRDVTLASLDGGVAEILLAGAGGGCGGPSTAELQDVVRDVVLGVAPELVEVRVPVERAPAAFVPLDALLRAPATPGAAR